MKHPLLFILCLSPLFLVSCSKENNDDNTSHKGDQKIDTITFSHSEKGWELYSWTVGKSWKYSLLIGTNAPKTIQQVKRNPIGVIGEDSLKMVLKKLPKNEEILWIGPKWLQNCWRSDFDNLKLPKTSVIIDIKEFCHKHSLKIIIEEK